MPLPAPPFRSIEEVVNKLEAIFSEEQLNEIAMKTGFIRRQRKFKASTFLKMLLFDHFQYQSPSLQQHALSMCQVELTSVSKQSVDKRFNNKSLLFIEKVFETLLNRQHLNTQINSHLSAHFNSVKVMDSTEFKLPDYFAEAFPGYSACNALACAAIQLEYDVLNGKVHHFSLSNARQSDKTVADIRMDSIAAGDLILRDLGYYSTDSYLKIEQQKAFYVSRLKSQVGIYQQQSGQYVKLSWSQILQQAQKNKTGFFDGWVYIGKEQKHPVRMVAWVLPEDASNNRLLKKQSKKGKLSKEDKIWSKLNVFVTNIESDILDVEQLYNLYKIRWQIELIFKTWKSIVNIHIVHKMKSCRLKCYLYSKFVWILICRDIIAIAEASYWKSKKALLSPYKCMAILKASAIGLKTVLFRNVGGFKEWLIKIIEDLMIYGYKENRKGRKKLTELLHLNDEIENNSFIFAMVQKNSHQHQTYPVNADGLKKQKTYMRNKIVPAGNRRDLFFS